MNQETISQDVILKNRSDLQISGVKKIESLNPKEFLVITVLGKILIKGIELEMKQLDVEKGILLISGKISLIEYLTKQTAEKEKGFISKLFKWFTLSHSKPY